MIEGMRIFQEKIGIRNIVMPGVRMRMIVVTKLTAPRMDDKPRRYRPITHRSPPTPRASLGVKSFIHTFEATDMYAPKAATRHRAQPTNAASTPASAPLAHPSGTAMRMVRRCAT